MPTVYSHLANATGELENLTSIINHALAQSVQIAQKEIGADNIDVIFQSAADLAIPEYGIGGYSPGPHLVYISFDPKSKDISKDLLFSTLLHEFHHCMRWRTVGYGTTLGESIISEGMACLYEMEVSSVLPIYAQVSISDKEIEQAKKLINSEDYNHSEWFFGSQEVARWFGYTYGYKLCKSYADKHKTSAKDMINLSANDILIN